VIQYLANCSFGVFCLVLENAWNYCRNFLQNRGSEGGSTKEPYNELCTGTLYLLLLANGRP
jgi:hypothetical protein